LAVLCGGPILEAVFGLRGYALPVLLKTKSWVRRTMALGMKGFSKSKAMFGGRLK